MRRSEVSPKLVWNGAINGMWISRRVILCKRMGLGPLGFRLSCLVFEFFRAVFWQTQARDGSGGFQNVVHSFAAAFNARRDVTLMQKFAEVVARLGLQARGGCAVLGSHLAEICGQRNGLCTSGGGQRTFGQDIY